MPKPRSSVLNVQDMDIIITVPSWEQWFKCEEYRHFDFQCFLESRHDNIVPSNDIDDSNAVEDVCLPSDISSLVEESLVNPGALIINESHVFCRY